MKFLALFLYLLARTRLTLISSAAIIGCLRRVNFQGFSLVIWNFELSAFLSALRGNIVFYWKLGKACFE